MIHPLQDIIIVVDSETKFINEIDTKDNVVSSVLLNKYVICESRCCELREGLSFLI